MVGVRARSRKLWAASSPNCKFTPPRSGPISCRSLEARFEEVKNRAERFRKEREVELEQMRRTGDARSREARSADMRQRSTEAARQVWERSEPLRQGAKDVGEGLARAWVELRASFGKAAGRLQTETRRERPGSGHERGAPRADLSRDSPALPPGLDERSNRHAGPRHGGFVLHREASRARSQAGRHGRSRRLTRPNQLGANEPAHRIAEIDAVGGQQILRA